MKLPLTCIIVLAIATLTATAQTLPSPTTTINTNTIVELVKIFPGFDGVKSPTDFFKAVGKATTFQGVYSFSTKGGLSSGGMAAAASVVDVTWNLADGPEPVFWSIHAGPAFVVGSDRSGIFTAVEAAAWTDKLKPWFDKLKASFPVARIMPEQVDNLYFFGGSGIATSGDREVGHSFIVSLGVGTKF